MQNKDLIIIALIVATIYLYYQNQKLRKLPAERVFIGTDSSTSQTLFEINDEEKNEELIADKDEAIRKKNEAEQEVLSLTNQLRNKQQEVTRKETEIERLKKEKSASEITLNKKLTEKNGLITTLQREVNQQKEKYSKQGQLLDGEQTENNKLEKANEKLTEKITELEAERENLLTEISKHDDLDAFQSWLNENEENKANLPDWDKILGEIKDKISDYHLSESNWASGLLKRNSKYWAVFKEWLDSNYD